MLEEAQVLSSAFPLLVFAVTRRLRLHGARQPGGAKDETSGDHKVESGRKARIGRAAQNQASSACVRACGRRPSTRTAGHVAVRMCVNKMSVLYWNSEDQAASERGGGGATGKRKDARRPSCPSIRLRHHDTAALRANGTLPRVSPRPFRRGESWVGTWSPDRDRSRSSSRFRTRTEGTFAQESSCRTASC